VTKTIRNLIAAVLLIGASHGAMAGFQTGNTLLALCENGHAGNRAMCSGYLQGIADSELLVNDPQNFVPLICIPTGVDGSQIEKVFVKYANENPEKLHILAAAIVSSAFIKAFPCK